MNKLLQCYWPPFFVIALILAAMMLNGCTVTPLPLSGANAESRTPVFATLANANDSIEMAAAPVVTKLAVYANTAADLADANKLTRSQRDQIRVRERLLRAELEYGIGHREIEKITHAKALLDVYLDELRSKQ